VPLHLPKASYLYNSHKKGIYILEYLIPPVIPASAGMTGGIQRKTSTSSQRGVKYINPIKKPRHHPVRGVGPTTKPSQTIKPSEIINQPQRRQINTGLHRNRPAVIVVEIRLAHTHIALIFQPRLQMRGQRILTVELVSPASSLAVCPASYTPNLPDTEKPCPAAMVPTASRLSAVVVCSVVPR